MSERAKAFSVLAMNTLAFTVCFAVWMMNGVLVTFLVDNKVFAFGRAEMGWLIGLPVLTGALLRLPAGILTDRFGGRPVFAAVMLWSALATFLTSYAGSFWSFALGGLAFGVAGSSFAVGVAYTSSWFPKEQQGTALGVFGAGTLGAALTSMFAPRALDALTAEGARLEAWRLLPRYYAAGVLLTVVVFWLFTYPRPAAQGPARSLGDRLAPLGVLRVWRFGLYYLLVFGGFVALAQWLIPYYVNVYSLSVASAGLMAAAFSLPSGLFRALGGWLSDRYGPRRVMYWVLGGCSTCCLLLSVPRMDIVAPGEGLMAEAAGEVRVVSQGQVVVGEKAYSLRPQPEQTEADRDSRTLIWPRLRSWQEPVVRVGQRVTKRQLLARGVTHIFFQANRGIFTGLVLMLALCMGVGMAAVYKYIPSYFPADVGAVGGLVGVLGGLGGFGFPIAFGYLLEGAGIWSTCWLIFFVLSVACLAWLHRVVQQLLAEGAAPPAQDAPPARAALPLEPFERRGVA